MQSSITYIGYRILQSIPAILGVSLIVFMIVRLTGDPAAALLPPEASAEAQAALRQEYGLDQPLPVQFFVFLKGLLVGDLGESIRYKTSVTGILIQRLPATLMLTGAALLLAVVVGVALGTLSALYQNKPIDTVARTYAAAGQAIPSFYLGIVLILIFGVWLKLLPTVGATSPKHLILPAITLAAYLSPLILRVTRGAILDELSKGYVLMAKSKGLVRRSIMFGHVAKNALPPVLTIVGMQLGEALGGAIIVEMVFSWPGLGQLLVSGIHSRDYPLVQGLVVYAALAFILINLLVDICYKLLDPRIEAK